jgi:hypothetical protein
MSVPPCRYYSSPSGCRNGDSCRFSHTSTDLASSTRPIGRGRGAFGSRGGPFVRGGLSMRGMSAASRGGTFNLAHNSGSSSEVPSGVCRFYWSTGSCKREFECRYRHTAPPQTAASGAGDDVAQPREINVTDYLKPEALARLSRSGTDAHFAIGSTSSSNLNPTTTHNSLKTFLYDSFRFFKTHNVYTFVKLLENASSMNSTWVCIPNPLSIRSFLTSRPSRQKMGR